MYGMCRCVGHRGKSDGAGETCTVTSVSHNKVLLLNSEREDEYYIPVRAHPVYISQLSKAVHIILAHHHEAGQPLPRNTFH